MTWTNLEKDTLRAISDVCMVLKQVYDHAGLRYSYVQAIDGLFDSLNDLIDHEAVVVYK